MGEIAVRRITPGDGPLLRSVRLAAIGDSPGAYATTLAEAAERDPDQWERVAEAHATATDQATWFAVRTGETAGMLSAYRTADGVVTLTSLFAGPGHRGVGVAEALLAAATEWAVAVGGTQLRLWVVERNEHARRFYARQGFEATGEEIAYEPDPSLIEFELRRDLPSDPPPA